ncbi:MAG TPA: methyltransferase domain-containing protein [Terriglobia bacterium]|jgi:SAM-dependent methyltransferase
MMQERIRREFNQWAGSGRGRGLEKGHWETTRQLIESMAIDEYHNVLDLGCGVGWATRVLAQKASRGIVVGVDLSDRMIAQARSGYRNPHNTFFVVADASGIPTTGSFFNALLSVESIYYYPELENAFSEVYRILKPGGKACFLISYYRENVYSHEWAKHIDLPVHLLSAEEYAAALKQSGFVSALHRRIIDSTPLPEDWKPTHWFPTRQDHLHFRAEGALLLSAEK